MVSLPHGVKIVSIVGLGREWLEGRDKFGGYVLTLFWIYENWIIMTMKTCEMYCRLNTNKVFESGFWSTLYLH